MAPVNRQDSTYRLRHSAAHVMAQAIEEMFPEAKLGSLREPVCRVGPAADFP
jgi:threonyl-tRNA synthetase